MVATEAVLTLLTMKMFSINTWFTPVEHLYNRSSSVTKSLFLLSIYSKIVNNTFAVTV